MPDTTARVNAPKPDPGDNLNTGASVTAAGLDAFDEIALIWRGAWDADTVYQPNDLVTMGGLYVASTQHSGHQPPDDAYWESLALPGVGDSTLIPSILGDTVVIDHRSHWGISPTGHAYYDTGTADDGDDAALSIDPDTGRYILTKGD